MILLDLALAEDQAAVNEGRDPEAVDWLQELFEFGLEEIEDVPDEQLATVTDMQAFVDAVNASMGGEG